MKKSLLVLGVAVAALASCTNEEVTEVAQNRAIQFSSFVNNTTKAANEATGVTSFYVFGQYGYSDSEAGTAVYDNELNTKLAYWQPSQTYRFGAYVDGTAKNENAEFDATTGTLEITGYTPSDNNDLMAAVSSEITTGTDVTGQGKVPLTFRHLLSIVKFTFNTTDADVYTLKISDLKIAGADSKADVSYAGTTPTWSNVTETNGYAFDGIADIAVEANNYTGSTAEFVIPQDGTDALSVTFTATISGGGIAEKSAEFTATLGYDATKDADTEVGTDNTWVAGYRYNYTATINASDINEDLEKNVIEFDVKMDSWKDANESTVTPSVVPGA